MAASVQQGLPKTKVLLWVYGEQLRAMFENVVLAEYHCPELLQSAQTLPH